MQAGRMKGRLLRVPPDAGTRPLLALIKKSLFDIISPRIPGSRVLDAFAGAGSFGIEAASRGAALVVMVENGPRVYPSLAANCSELCPGERARLVREDAFRAMNSMGRGGEKFEIVFLDPPFAMDSAESLLAAASRLLAEEGVVLLRVPSGRKLPEKQSGLSLRREKKYGASRVGFYYHSSPEPFRDDPGGSSQEDAE